jgi:hypothetical protein
MFNLELILKIKKLKINPIKVVQHSTHYRIHNPKHSTPNKLCPGRFTPRERAPVPVG